MAQEGLDAPVTVREVMGYFKDFEDHFNNSLWDIPTKADMDNMKQEGLLMWRQWQQDIQNTLKDIPTKQDLLAMKEQEGRLCTYLHLTIIIIGILVGIGIVLIGSPRITAETPKGNCDNQHDVHNTYSIGTLGSSWLQKHTVLQLLSGREGWAFFQYPIEHNMSISPGNTPYFILDKEDAKLQSDELLHSINIKSTTALSLFIHYDNNGDATFTIPADKCSHDYVIPMHTFCDKSTGKISLFTPHSDSQVTITFRQVSGLVNFRNRLYKSGEHVSVFVPRRKILTITHTVSLAGTTLHSTVPICVIAGTVCKDDEPRCKSVVTTVLPSTQLSRSFIVPNVVGRWSLLQLLSPTDENKAVIDHYGQRDQQVLKTSETYNRDLVGVKPMVITSDQDLVVTVLARPTKLNTFLLWIVGVDQYRSSYQFYIPHYTDNFIHELYVICKTHLKDELRLNNKLIRPIPDSKQIVRVGSDEYEGFRVSVFCRTTYLMEHKNMETFGLYIFGYPGDDKEDSHYTSYGYPAGVHLH